MSDGPALLAFIQTVADARARSIGNEGYAYRGPEDFVLREGWLWPQRARSLPILGHERACFQNSAVVARRRRTLAYVEGWAMTSFGFPCHHAWLVDNKDGTVVETTWDEPGGAYFGVAFQSTFLTAYLRGSRWTSVIDNPDRGPSLLRGKYDRAEFLHPKWRRTDGDGARALPGDAAVLPDGDRRRAQDGGAVPAVAGD